MADTDWNVKVKIAGLEALTKLGETFKKIGNAYKNLDKDPFKKIYNGAKVVGKQIEKISEAIVKVGSIAYGAALTAGAALLNIGSDYNEIRKSANTFAGSVALGTQAMEEFEKATANTGLELNDVSKKMNLLLSTGLNPKLAADLAVSQAYMEKMVEDGGAVAGHLADMASNVPLTATHFEDIGKALKISKSEMLNILKYTGKWDGSLEGLDKIIADFNKSFGGSKRALDAILQSDPYKKLAESAKNSGTVADKLKNKLIKSIADATKGMDFEAMFKPLFDLMSNKDIQEAFKNSLMSISDAIKSIDPQTVTTAIKLMADTIKFLIDNAGWLIGTLFGVVVATKALRTALLINEALDTFGISIIGVTKNLITYISKTALAESVTKLLSFSFKLVKVAAVGLMDIFLGLAQLIWGALVAAFNAVVAGLTAIAAMIGISVGWLLLIIAVVAIVAVLIWYYWDDIVDAFKSAVTWIGELITDVLNYLSGLGSSFAEIGTNIINGIVNGLKNAASMLWNTIKDIATGALDIFKSIFDINSPSKEMKKIGKWNIEGLTIGQEDQSKDLYKSTASIAGATLGSTADNVGSVTNSTTNDNKSTQVNVYINGNNTEEMKSVLFGIFRDLNLQNG